VQRIASELTKAGLDPVRARCVGQSLERDLSIVQLKQLRDAARSLHPNGAASGSLGEADLIRVSAQITDSGVAIAVARAVGACA
jgi:hypothetical protein